jgi:hypothetical protein
MGDGPIPWLAVEQYGHALDLDEEQMHDLHAHITAMDAEYLKWSADRREREAKRRAKAGARG